MLCQNCGKNTATFHYKQSVNGAVNERHLCAECASKEGNTEAAFMNPDDYMNSMLQGFFGVTCAPRADSITCPLCGAVRRNIEMSGKVGCARCYDVFSDLLNPYVRRIHGSGQHMGKLPAGAGASIRARRELERLNNELKTAVEKQEFELAAIIRDKIKAFREVNVNE